jgi:hypothetical protein
MNLRHSLKQSICTLWGHDYVLTPVQNEFVVGGQDSICRRCGKEHFRAYGNEVFPDIPLNSARESMMNFSHMNRNPDLTHEIRH